MENRLGLTTVTGLLAVVTTLTLREGRGLARLCGKEELMLEYCIFFLPTSLFSLSLYLCLSHHFPLDFFSSTPPITITITVIIIIPPSVFSVKKRTVLGNLVKRVLLAVATTAIGLSRLRNVHHFCDF